MSIVVISQPELLVLGIHHSHLAVSCHMKSGNILIEGLFINSAVLVSENVSNTVHSTGLHSLVQVEYTIKLRVTLTVEGVVLVVVGIEPVGSIVVTSEGSVRNRSKSQMDGTSSLCSAQVMVDIVLVL